MTFEDLRRVGITDFVKYVRDNATLFNDARHVTKKGDIRWFDKDGEPLAREISNGQSSEFFIRGE